MASMDFDQVDFDAGQFLFRADAPLTRHQKRELKRRGWKFDLTQELDNNHDRALDPDFLVGVEENPGPQGKSSNAQGKQKAKPKPKHGKTQNMQESLKDQLAKALAEVDAHKERIKEVQEKFNEPLLGLKMQTDMVLQEKALKQALRDAEDKDNSITFPEMVPDPRPVDPDVYPFGAKRKTLFISKMKEESVSSWMRWNRLMAIYWTLSISFFVFICVALDFLTWRDLLQPDWAYTWDSSYTVIFVVVCSHYPIAMIILALHYACAKPTCVNLVGVAVDTNEVKTDDRPEFDRGDKLAPQKFVDYKLYAEVRHGDNYVYLDHHSVVYLPEFWFDGLGRASRLKTLHLNVGLMASALNRKTLGLRSNANKDAARIERSFRLVGNNSAYQEDYNRLLQTGDSSYSDMQLFAGTVLSGDPTVNPSAFC